MNFIVTTTTDAATASPHIGALPSASQQKEARVCVRRLLLQTASKRKELLPHRQDYINVFKRIPVFQWKCPLKRNWIHSFKIFIKY
jgi:hypothetical protein